MIGDRVAAVAAESKAAADEAARLVEVEYEELPLVTIENALDPDAPILHPDTDELQVPGAEAAADAPPQRARIRARSRSPRPARTSRTSSPARTTCSSTRSRWRASSRASSSRAPASLWIDEDDRVHIINTNKAPAQFRQQLASGLGIPADRIVVDATFIGGDFGGKGLSIDEYACYFLAKATGRPIKAVMSYLDEMQASNARHPAILKLRTAVDRDGKFLAHQSDVIIDGGAYAAGKASPGLIVPAHQTLTRVPHAGHPAGSSMRSTPTASPAARCARRAIRSRCSRARATST